MNLRQQHIRIYLLVAFGTFLASMLICVLLRPDLFDHPDYGFSFYASLAETAALYVIGLLTTAVCLWAIARELKPYPKARPLRLGYLWGAACLLGIILTPMGLHPILWWTHIAISFVLLVTQVAVVAWILLQKNTPWIDYIVGLIFFASGIATVLSGTWPGMLGIYAIGELGIFSSEIFLLGRAALRAVASE